MSYMDEIKEYLDEERAKRGFRDALYGFITKEVNNAIASSIPISCNTMPDFHKAASIIVNIMSETHRAFEEAMIQTLSGFLLNLEAKEMGK